MCEVLLKGMYLECILNFAYPNQKKMQGPLPIQIPPSLQRALVGCGRCGMLDGSMWTNHVGTPTPTTSTEQKYKRHWRESVIHIMAGALAVPLLRKWQSTCLRQTTLQGPVHLHLLPCELEVRETAGCGPGVQDKVREVEGNSRDG